MDKKTHKINKNFNAMKITNHMVLLKLKSIIMI